MVLVMSSPHIFTTNSGCSSQKENSHWIGCGVLNTNEINLIDQGICSVCIDLLTTLIVIAFKLLSSSIRSYLPLLPPALRRQDLREADAEVLSPIVIFSELVPNPNQAALEACIDQLLQISSQDAGGRLLGTELSNPGQPNNNGWSSVTHPEVNELRNEIQQSGHHFQSIIPSDHSSAEVLVTRWGLYSLDTVKYVLGHNTATRSTWTSWTTLQDSI